MMWICQVGWLDHKDADIRSAHYCQLEGPHTEHVCAKCGDKHTQTAGEEFLNWWGDARENLLEGWELLQRYTVCRWRGHRWGIEGRRGGGVPPFGRCGRCSAVTAPLEER